MSSSKKVVITVGLPGSGKSTYLAKLGVNPISSDAIRRQLADDETDQTIHARVFATARYLLKQRLDLGRPVGHLYRRHESDPERTKAMGKDCKGSGMRDRGYLLRCPA